MAVQLHGNQVGAEGGRALMAALKVLGAERDLGLKGCVFKEAVGFPARPPIPVRQPGAPQGESSRCAFLKCFRNRMCSRFLKPEVDEGLSLRPASPTPPCFI